MNINTALHSKLPPQNGSRPLPETVEAPIQKTTMLGSSPNSAITDASAVNIHITSLKILAVSLLRQIEELERENAAGSAQTLDLQAEVRRFEAELIRNALKRTKGRQRRAARLLRMKVTTLNTKIKKYHLSDDQENPASQ